MTTIHFDPCDGHSPELSLTCHRYNVADEIARIMRWGGKITRISANSTSIMAGWSYLVEVDQQGARR